MGTLYSFRNLLPQPLNRYYVLVIQLDLIATVISSPGVECGITCFRMKSRKLQVG